MLIQTHTISPSGLLPRTLVSARTPFQVSQLSGIMDLFFRKMKNRGAIVSASEGQNSSVDTGRKRKVVEHVCLLKAKEDLSDENEKIMLDYLYTSQYQMGGVVAVSLGRISDENNDNYTHAFFMRFQSKEDLAKFYCNPFYLGVLRDYVMPYCHGLLDVDYESEVEDEILLIFRKGEEFNYGVEFILLIEFVERALGRPVEDALASLAKLMTESPSLIVQATQGSNINMSNREYTHGMVVRFRSLEAFKIFMGSSEYEDKGNLSMGWYNLMRQAGRHPQREWIVPVVAGEQQSGGGGGGGGETGFSPTVTVWSI